MAVAHEIQVKEANFNRPSNAIFDNFLYSLSITFQPGLLMTRRAQNKQNSFVSSLSSFERSLCGARSRGRADRNVSTSRGLIAVRQSSGTKLPVLLLYGESLSKEIFDPILDGPLGQRYRLIAIDLPGDSSGGLDADGARSVSGIADAALQVLEVLDIDYAAVLGHSLGALVAIELADSFPGLVGLALSGLPIAVPTRAPKLVSPEELLAAPPVDGRGSGPRTKRAAERADLSAEQWSSVLSEHLGKLPTRVPRSDIPVRVIGNAAQAASQNPPGPTSFSDSERNAPRWLSGRGGAARWSYPTFTNLVNKDLGDFLRDLETLHENRLAEPILWFGG